MKKMWAVLFVSVGLVVSSPAFCQGPGADGEALAGQVLDLAGVSRGLCSIVGCDDAALPLAVARQSGLLVHVIDPRAEVVEEIRAVADGAGVALDRLVVECGPAEPLPYASGIVDVLVVIGGAGGRLDDFSLAEALRVLRPRGKVILGAAQGNAGASRIRQALRSAEDAEVKKNESGVWGVVVKPEPEGLDDWSHWEHGPDNNPVSTDAVIRAPYMTQWLATPYYIAMPAITTAAGGRTFVAMGHIAHHVREEEWLNTLLARNGYNGAELWRLKLPDGYLVHRSAFIATDDAFYLIDPTGSGVLVLNPETGEEQGRIHIPEFQGEWKWIAMADGKLFALVGDLKDPAETTLVRSPFQAWSWGELSQGYYALRVPWGFGETMLAYDLAKDRLLWSRRESEKVDSRAMVIGDDKVYFYCPDEHLGCLDADSGDVIWLNDDAELRKLIEQPGHGLSSTPGFRSTCFCVYTPKGLFYEAQTRMNLVAVNKDDGQYKWHRRKTTNNPNVISLDGKILAGIGPDGSTLLLDPETGETIEDLGFKKRSCVRLTATPDSLFCRGYPEGLTRYDRVTKQITFDGSMRPACNDGVIGANGLLYVGPWLCDCNLSIMGTAALCSAGQPDPESPERPQLETAGVEAARGERLKVSEKDWEAYRGGNDHSGSTEAAVSSRLLPVWEWNPEVTLPCAAPTAAGGLVFVAGEDGKVRALDIATGDTVWSFQTAGPILQPPTLWEGRAYVGSGDGYLYVLEAATGHLLWRFRSAPVERRVMVYGNLGSTWPVNSGVVVEDGVAYFAGGIIDYDGTHVYALDAKTGECVWANKSTGHLDESLGKGVSAQGNLAVLNDALWMAGGNLVSPSPYVLGTGEYTGPPPGDGSPRTNRGEEIGVLRGECIVHGGRLRYSALSNVVSPGRFEVTYPGKGSMTLCAGRICPAWDDDLMVYVSGQGSVPVADQSDAIVDKLKGGGGARPSRAWSAQALQGSLTLGLALGKDAVVTVCETPRPRQRVPRWRIVLLDRESGKLLDDHDLPSPPRPNGIAIDREGRILVALMDGSLMCFGGDTNFRAHVDGLVESANRNADAVQQVVTQLQELLRRVPDEQGRRHVMGAFERLGIDPRSPARENGCIVDWRLLGPVPWDNGQFATDKVLVGEPDVNVKKTCRVGDTELKWAEYATVDTSGAIDLAVVYGPHLSRAAYAYAEVELPEAADLLLKVGSNDGFKCWFNGDEVGRFDGGRVYAPDQNALKVRAKAGTNTVLLKITQIGGGWGFGARLTAMDGKAVNLSKK